MLPSLLHHTTACSLLKAGCQQLGLPDFAAVELVRFLFVKRCHDNLDNARRPRRMSPGTTLDRLWHWMLLNTRVYTAVHELVGGVVEHVGTDEQDLPDSTKMMQRLYSMSILRHEGWEPQVELWEDSGTCMQGIYLREPWDDEDAPDVFVSEATSEQQYEELLDDMRVLFTGHSRQNGWTAPTLTEAPSEVTSAAEGSEAGSQHAVTLAGGCNTRAADSRWTICVLAEARRNKPERVHRVQATLSTTVRLLKQQVLQEGIFGEDGESDLPLSSVRVFHGRKELEDDMLEPTEHEAWLRVMLPGQEAPPEKFTYTLSVRTLTDCSMTVTEWWPWCLVRELKDVLGEKVGRSAGDMRLVFAGRQLEDDRTLGLYNIQKESTIHLIYRLEGC